MESELCKKLKDVQDFLEGFGSHDMDEYVKTLKEAIGDLELYEEREFYKNDRQN